MRSILVVSAVLLACGGPYRPRAHKDPEPPIPPACTPQDCDGCCSDGVCMRAPTSSFCGGGGLACFACPAGEFCGAERRCEPIAGTGGIDAHPCTVTLAPLVVEPPRRLTAVWAGAEGAWAVGPAGAMVLEGDRLVPAPNDAQIGVDLRAIWAAGPSGHAAWIIRSGISAAIRHELPGLGLDEASPTGAELYAVWGRGEADVYVAGAEGKVARWHAGAWTVEQPATSTIIALAGHGKLGGFAITSSELFIEQNNHFVSVGTAPGPLAGGIFVSAPRDVWLSGTDGRLHRWVDGRWTSLNVSQGLVGGLWAQSRQTLFFTLPNGVGFFDGDRTAFVPFSNVQLNAINGTTSARALAVGDGTALLARCARPEELNNSIIAGGNGYPTSGSGGSAPHCVTTCVYVNGLGCVVETTHCS